MHQGPKSSAINLVQLVVAIKYNRSDIQSVVVVCPHPGIRLLPSTIAHASMLVAPERVLVVIHRHQISFLTSALESMALPSALRL
jgi:hypothetical protein